MACISLSVLNDIMSLPAKALTCAFIRMFPYYIMADKAKQGISPVYTAHSITIDYVQGHPVNVSAYSPFKTACSDGIYVTILQGGTEYVITCNG